MAKPWKIPYLNPEDTLKVCLRKILRTRYREAFSFEQGTIEGQDIEALHNMRVSVRRLQSTMKVFRGSFSKKKFKYHYDRVRQLLRILGRVRDLDVFIDMLEQHTQTLSPRDRSAVTLLIAREKNLRVQERGILLDELSAIREEGYEKQFFQSITKAL